VVGAKKMVGVMLQLQVSYYRSITKLFDCHVSHIIFPTKLKNAVLVHSLFRAPFSHLLLHSHLSLSMMII
jgi:hypothetical protein